MDPAKHQIFRDASGQIFSLILRPCLMSADISDALWFILNFLVDLSPWVDSRTLPLLPPAAERKHKLGTGSSSLSTNQKAGKPGGERNGQ